MEELSFKRNRCFCLKLKGWNVKVLVMFMDTRGQLKSEMLLSALVSNTVTDRNPTGRVLIV